ncbi:MAG TPA: hypothetical protein VF881_08450 [Polyangiaceae bacterium]
MTISNSNPVNATVMAEQIQELMHELSTELAKEEREINRDARQHELEQSLEAVEHMRDKANALEMGGYASGLLTIASAGGQAIATTQFDTSGSHEGDATNKKVDGWNGVAKTGGGLANSVSQVYGAKAENQEAFAQGAQARSKASGRQADEAETNRQQANKVDDAAKELYKEIARNQHAGIMAIVARQ